MIVVLTDAAEADLEEIAGWIARDSPERALSFVAELRQRCESLEQAPLAYSLVPRYEHAGVRRRVYRDYLIFYRISEDTIEVLHVLHGARDLEPILFPGQHDPP
jgi:plasmid stabilization system protein ParE